MAGGGAAIQSYPPPPREKQRGQSFLSLRPPWVPPTPPPNQPAGFTPEAFSLYKNAAIILNISCSWIKKKEEKRVKSNYRLKSQLTTLFNNATLFDLKSHDFDGSYIFLYKNPDSTPDER